MKKPKSNKYSQVQLKMEMYPYEWEEFLALERSLCVAGIGGFIDPRYSDAAQKRLDELDNLFGFAQESQFRKVGIEVSHWANR